MAPLLLLAFALAAAPFSAAALVAVPAGLQAAAPADSTFLMTAARAGNAEIALADLAARRSTDADVKAMAEKLKADHQAMGADLEALAAKVRVTLPTDVTDQQKSIAEKLAKLIGPAFDKAYLQTTVNDHQDALKMFTQAGKFASPGVKAFIDQALVMLNDHLRRAITLQKRVPAP